MDYGSVDTTLQFDACEMRSCVNVSITNDDTLENTESFFVNLERNGLDNRITLDPTRGEIEILDDDDSMDTPYTCVLYNNVSHSLQWLWWVWRRHSTVQQREKGQLKCVPLCTCQTILFPAPSPLNSLSISPMLTLLQVP